MQTGGKVVQQMTRDGAVEINKSTGETVNISAREPDVSPASATIGGVIERVQTEHRIAKKNAVKRANRKIFERGQHRPKTSRLKFTDAEINDPAMSKVIRKSDRAADRYEKARALVQDKPPNGKLTHTLERPGQEAVALVRNEVRKYESDNTGVEAAHFTERTAESAARRIGDVHSRLQFEPQQKMFRAEEKAVKANANAIYRRDLQVKPELENAGAAKKAAYKRKLKKDYAKAFRQGNIEGAKETAVKVKKTAEKVKKAAVRTVEFVAANGKWIAIVGGGLFLIILLVSGIGSCMSMFGGGFNAVIGTSYTAEDADILGADADYTALENALAAKINNIPNAYPGYDEYNYYLDEIGHDPFELASYLTAKYNAYRRGEVQGELAAIFAQQYTLTITSVTEIRYRTEWRIAYYYDDDGNLQSYWYTIQVPYNYYILNVTLVSRIVGSVALANLTPEQAEMYAVYMETKGNKPYLFP